MTHSKKMSHRDGSIDLKTLNIQEMRSALSHLDELVAKAGEVVVTRRGRPLARILPAHPRRNIPPQAKLRASMPRLKVPSEVLVREDRKLR
jgi:prevent-host-death family protein